jgi:hypothetical protein
MVSIAADAAGSAPTGPLIISTGRVIVATFRRYPE